MKSIPLTKGKVALVDDEDYDRVVAQGKWSAVRGRNDTWYAQRRPRANGKRKPVYMYRFILGITDPTIEVDHEDHDGLNNRRYNLRSCSRRQNSWNMGKQATNSSGFKGVDRFKGSSWRARISTKERIVELGLFATAKDAAHAYDVAAEKYHGEFASFNFPGEILSEEEIERRRLKKYDRRWINDGKKSRFWNNGTPLPMGWDYGRTSL